MKEIQLDTHYLSESVVDSNMLACTVGSGDLKVLATPVMVALMENAGMNCLSQFLDDGETSVGTAISTTHCAATPLGMKIKAEAKIISINGRQVDFEITAYDEVGLIGKATHSRFIVLSEKFQAKVDSKLK
ncbi:MAG: thioesterase family protein [Clostridiales bacterium]|nr:thioesterase family protein [Clostridiales bacterium]